MEKSQKEIFGIRLAGLRKERNISQRRVSQDTNISLTTITKYETSVRNPSYEDLTALAKYYDTTTDYLLGLSDIKATDTNLKAVCKYTGLSEEAVQYIIENTVQNSINANVNEILSNVLNIILTERAFWKIVFQYAGMPGAFSQNETAANYTALINDSKDNHFSMYQREQKREKILKADQEIDVVRYAVIKSIEQISNIFDYRVMIPEKYKHTKILNQEAPDNGNDNPQEE